MPGAARVRVLPMLAAALLPAAALAAAAVAGREAPGVTAQRLWTFAHLVLFVFWLGADLGVVLAVRAAARAGLADDQRRRTLELARAIDLAPRLAASLMLTVGGVLTEYVGIAHPWWQLAGIVVLGPAWLTLVLVAFAGGGSRAAMAAARLEDGLRRLLVVAVPLSVAWSWFSGRLDPAPYVAAKLLLFALLMGLGLRVRAAWRDLESGRGAAAAGTAMAVARLNALLPVMMASWLALAVAAWLGVTRPGEQPPAGDLSAAVQPR